MKTLIKQPGGLRGRQPLQIALHRQQMLAHQQAMQTQQLTDKNCLQTALYSQLTCTDVSRDIILPRLPVTDVPRATRLPRLPVRNVLRPTVGPTIAFPNPPVSIISSTVPDANSDPQTSTQQPGSAVSPAHSRAQRSTTAEPSRSSLELTMHPDTARRVVQFVCDELGCDLKQDLLIISSFFTGAPLGIVITALSCLASCSCNAHCTTYC